MQPVVLFASALLVVLIGGDAVLAHRRWSHPALVAFLLAWSLGAIVVGIESASAREATQALHSLSASVRSTLVGLSGVTALLAPTAAVLAGTRRFRVAQRAAILICMLPTSVMLAMLTLMYATCMADFGCI